MKKIFLMALIASSLSIISCKQAKQDEIIEEEVIGGDADQGGSFPVVDTTGKKKPNKAIE